MKVEEVMTRDVITCKPSDPIESVVKLMSEKDISGLPVIEGNMVVGVVTEADIMRLLVVPEPFRSVWMPSPLEVLIEIPVKEILQLRHLQQSVKDVGEQNVGTIMQKDVLSVAPDDDIEDAAAEMVKHKVNRLVVLKSGKLVGIITRDDIIHGLGGTANK
ncbi:MAG TPA: CBS domain-containing protein [Methanocella sp.]|uniref:CBS domain-containing protein n=1 Tax=Methanocella sp. TaxID=2052833 RepID=UPI002B75826C|nr:CBS domain-containing protein [Methanocella sp.]HTY89687.1 CBS domain-containing protein [Methanocella sp.]